MLGEVEGRFEGRSPVLYPDSAEATAGATARGLVDLIVVDVGEGGPSVCSGRDGLRQRLAVAATRGVATCRHAPGLADSGMERLAIG